MDLLQEWSGQGKADTVDPLTDLCGEGGSVSIRSYINNEWTDQTVTVPV